MNDQNNVFPIDKNAPVNPDNELLKDELHTVSPDEEEKIEQVDKPVLPPREELEKIISEIPGKEELDSMWLNYPDYQSAPWFKVALDTRFNELLREQFRAEVREKIAAHRYGEKSTDKKKGYMRLVHRERTEVLYGYGELHMNLVIKLTIIEGNGFISENTYHCLPISDWSIAIAEDEKQFVEWLGGNKYYQYLESQQADAAQVNMQRKLEEATKLSEYYENMFNEQLQVNKEIGDIINKYTEEILHPFKTFWKKLFKKESVLTTENFSKIQEQSQK